MVAARKRRCLCTIWHHCYTYIPNNTVLDGAFTKALLKPHELRTEVKDNTGHDKHIWNWFDFNLGKWGAWLARIGIAMGIGLIVLFLMMCCVIPIVCLLITKTVSGQMAGVSAPMYWQVK